MKKTRQLVSIGIPCFNEEDNVMEAYNELKKVTRPISAYDFEYIFVDNRSVDGTRTKIQQLVRSDSSVKGVYLSRNFGPEASSQACFDFAKGDAVIWFPCDLQEPAELIPKFIKKWEEGYDSVVGIYTKLEDPWTMAFLRKMFYQTMKCIANIEIPINSSGYGLYTRKVVDAMASLSETYRFERGIRSWVGFTTAYCQYARRKRERGKSSYSIFGYIHHAERSVFGFSYLPLDLLIYAGFFLVLLSFLFIIGYICFFLFFGNPIKGAVTILVSIVFFGGINLLALSVIGKYIQVIVEETKHRPTYIVDTIEGKK